LAVERAVRPLFQTGFVDVASTGVESSPPVSTTLPVIDVP